MHNIPPSCTSSPCNLLFLSLEIYSLVQAAVGAGTVLIWDFCVAFTRGGGCFVHKASVIRMMIVPHVVRVADWVQKAALGRTLVQRCVAGVLATPQFAPSQQMCTCEYQYGILHLMHRGCPVFVCQQYTHVHLVHDNCALACTKETRLEIMAQGIQLQFLEHDLMLRAQVSTVREESGKFERFGSSQSSTKEQCKEHSVPVTATEGQ